MAIKDRRKLIVISGYYGFGNLGDEAILEQLISELKQLVLPEQIYVLSAKPSATAAQFEVKAISRWDTWGLACILPKTRLFISGGGGLFQETRSPGSVIFYAGQLLLARARGAPSLIYAQGLGPFRSALGHSLTRLALSLCQDITLRDSRSLSLSQQWGLTARLTADPVWCLQSSPLPPAVQEQLKALRSSQRPLLGLSLRPSPNFQEAHLNWLVQSLQVAAAGSQVLLLPLQSRQDQAWLEQAQQKLQSAGLPSTIFNPAGLQRPSQWISLIQQCDLMISMRLHALILALQAGLPVLGIGYDPKVIQLLADFHQPMLNLDHQACQSDWQTTVQGAFSSQQELARAALAGAQVAKNLACQNFALLAKILDR